VRAVVFREVGRVEVADVAEPALTEPGDAIVRVTRAAICGSDLHYVRGKTPLAPGDVIGHEAVGVVERVGSAVTRLAPGDRVVASFDVACGACWFCANAQSGLCDELRMLGGGPFLGSLPGAHAELVRVPGADVNLLPIPDGLEDERALFLGDVMTTGYFAAASAGIAAGAVVAVVGAGPVGYFCMQAALALGGARVFGIDPDPSRRELVAAAGAEPVDPAARHPETVLADATEGRGADVAIDAVGSPAALQRAVDVVRRGGSVVVVGVYASELLEIQLGVYWARALTIRFTGLCPVHAWWQRAMDEVLAGRLDPEPLISHRLPLEDAVRGYELFERREATKVVLIP
jgi:2-desacetyl-2-hydroxyethyl bacteriochlorophyllide A dehydrogenase